MSGLALIWGVGGCFSKNRFLMLLSRFLVQVDMILAFLAIS